MEYIFKRSINLFGKNNIIKFVYNVEINSNKNGFKNFDINDEELAINRLLNKLNDKEIMKLNKMNPIYISLSNYFFNNLGNLLAIEYETGDSIAKITRKDLI